MKKILTLFQRNYDGDRLVRDEIVPGAEWVADGEGTATEKIDGTSCLVRDGVLYKRYDAKNGFNPPPLFIPAQAEPDPATGHWPGWLPVGDGPEDRWHREAWNYREAARHVMSDWTYELIGPKVQGNKYHLVNHVLERHGIRLLTLDATPPRDFAGLREWFGENVVEGIVWWRDLSTCESDMVKIKRRDFGLPW